MRSAIVVSLLASLLLTVGARPAHAKSPKKAKDKALAAIEDAAKSVKKALKDELKQDRDALYANLDALEADAKQNGATANSALALGDVLLSFQGQVRTYAIGLPSSQFAVAVHDAIAAAEASGVAQEDLPDGFFYGDGSVADQLRTDVDDLLAKNEEKVRKRVDQTIEKLEKHGGVRVQCRLEPPCRYTDAVVSSTVVDNVSAPEANIIAVLIGARVTTEQNGGVLFIGGFSSPDTSLDVERTSVNATTTSTFQSDSNGEFLLVQGGLGPKSFSIAVHFASVSTGETRAAIAIR